jgi:hypothetical protein
LKQSDTAQMQDGVDTVHYVDLCMPSADDVEALYGDGVDTVHYDDTYSVAESRFS